MLKKQVVHLIELCLQGLVLSVLVREFSLGFSALVFEVVRLLGASVFEPLLAGVLLRREPEPEDG
jgi:hypothetical protein